MASASALARLASLAASFSADAHITAARTSKKRCPQPAGAAHSQPLCGLFDHAIPRGFWRGLSQMKLFAVLQTPACTLLDELPVAQHSSLHRSRQGGSRRQVQKACPIFGNRSRGNHRCQISFLFGSAVSTVVASVCITYTWASGHSSIHVCLTVCLLARTL